MAERIGLPEACDLLGQVLARAGAAPWQAGPTAAALVAAEADGLKSHGLARAPAYADQVRSGKVDGQARPQLERTGDATLRVDAASGFAFPAIAQGLDAVADTARQHGMAAVAVRDSHHAGVMGHHVEQLAERGLVGLGFTNSPAAIAPWGGSRALFGTNPIAFACPRANVPPLVIDTSLSRVARGKIMLAAQRGETIPEGWALDADGRPSTDAKAALTGTMLPMGDAKGAALVLMVEILAAALTGGRFAFEASSFFTAEGEAPRIGQLFMALDPERLGGAGWGARMETLLGAVADQPGVRLPGERRLAARAAAARDGMALDPRLRADLEERARQA